MRLSKEQRENWTKEQKRYYKLTGNILEEKSVQNNIDLVTVICVRFGNLYGRDYVEKLRNMVSRNLTVPYKFVCLTDDHHPIEGVQTIYQPNAGYRKGWWHKVHMFDPFLPVSGRLLYFDLDVVIHGNIDKLVQSYNTEFVGIRDFNRKFHSGWKYLNSSIMTWIHGTQSEVWLQFQKDPNVAQKFMGDQDWIWKLCKDKIKFFPEEWIQSYKWEIRSRNDLSQHQGKRKFKIDDHQIRPNPDCSVCVFHGEPKPQDVKDQFIVDNWR
jgi:hypothetical protein